VFRQVQRYHRLNPAAGLFGLLLRFRLAVFDWFLHRLRKRQETTCITQAEREPGVLTLFFSFSPPNKNFGYLNGRIIP
jgi:hypothetical protein